MRLCFMVFAMFSTIYYNIARKRDATASDDGRWGNNSGGLFTRGSADSSRLIL